VVMSGIVWTVSLGTSDLYVFLVWVFQVGVCGRGLCVLCVDIYIIRYFWEYDCVWVLSSYRYICVVYIWVM